MPAQFDYQAGLDLSGLTSVTQAQLMQAINQIAPLSNIAGILVGPVATYDAAFMAANPRCTRYLLIDTTALPYTLKTYQSGAWEASTVGIGAIDSAAQFADNIITLAKLYVAAGNAYKIIQVNDASDGFELKNPGDIFTANQNQILLTYLKHDDGSNGQIIRKVGGVPAWATYDPAVDIITLAVSKLETGAEKTLLQTVSGLTTWVSNNDVSSNFLAAGTNAAGIKLAKLCNNSAAAGSMIKSNGSNLIFSTPVVDLFNGAWEGAGVNVSTNGWLTFTIPLATLPKIIIPYLECIATHTVAGGTWTTGTRYDMASIRAAGDDSSGTFKYLQTGALEVTCYFYTPASAELINDAGTSGAPTWTNFNFNVFYIP